MPPRWCQQRHYQQIFQPHCTTQVPQSSPLSSSDTWMTYPKKSVKRRPTIHLFVWPTNSINQSSNLSFVVVVAVIVALKTILCRKVIKRPTAVGHLSWGKRRRRRKTTMTKKKEREEEEEEENVDGDYQEKKIARERKINRQAERNTRDVATLNQPTPITVSPLKHHPHPPPPLPSPVAQNKEVKQGYGHLHCSILPLRLACPIMGFSADQEVKRKAEEERRRKKERMSGRGWGEGGGGGGGETRQRVVLHNAQRLTGHGEWNCADGKTSRKGPGTRCNFRLLQPAIPGLQQSQASLQQTRRACRAIGRISIPARKLQCCSQSQRGISYDPMTHSLSKWEVTDCPARVLLIWNGIARGPVQSCNVCREHCDLDCNLW